MGCRHVIISSKERERERGGERERERSTVLAARSMNFFSFHD
jgi:hypothetical protein